MQQPAEPLCRPLRHPHPHPHPHRHRHRHHRRLPFNLQHSNLYRVHHHYYHHPLSCLPLSCLGLHQLFPWEVLIRVEIRVEVEIVKLLTRLGNPRLLQLRLTILDILTLGNFLLLHQWWNLS